MSITDVELRENMNQGQHEEMSHHDKLWIYGKAGQAAILESRLKAGVPLRYQDENGDWVQKNPDGSITLLRKKES